MKTASDWRMHYFLRKLVNERIVFTRDILRMRDFTSKDLFDMYKQLRVLGYNLRRKELSAWLTGRSKTAGKKKGGKFLNNNGTEVVYYI